MKPEEIEQAFDEWRKKHARPSWSPIKSESANSTSWFGGTPSFSSTGDWPSCTECKKPMQFFMQLDLDTLPETFNAIQRSGVVQLFYCSNDDGMCETWAPFTGTHDIRLVSESQAISRPSGTVELAKNTISGWTEFIDTPHPEEHESCGLTYDYDFDNGRISVKSTDPDISFADLDINLDVAELISVPQPGDKLGGWPYWIQGVEYPNCPECNTQMELLVQIDSEDNVDHMFGDAGCAHLTQCREHPHILAFGWACG